MWNWFNCHLSGRHDYGMWCERGTIFLRCAHCGKRSTGWAIDRRLPDPPPASARLISAASPSRVVPFARAAAR